MPHWVLHHELPEVAWGLRGSFESLDPCVRMQILKRGLKRMKMETKESVNQKIKDLRTGITKDKAEKTQDGRRRAERAGAEADENQGSREETSRAGAHEERKVRFWEAPEEFRVDYTKGEDLKNFVNGPDPTWGCDRYEPQRTHPGRGGETAPEEARKLVQEAQRLADGVCEGHHVGGWRAWPRERGAGRTGVEKLGLRRRLEDE